MRSQDLVSSDVLYNVNNLMDKLNLDSEEYVSEVPDYDTALEYYISDLDFYEIEEMVSDLDLMEFTDLTRKADIPDEAPETTDHVCEDCFLYLVNGELPPDNTEEENEDIIAGGIEGHPTGEDEEFSIDCCDNCGTRLAGARYGMCDGSETTDMDERVKFMCSTRDTTPHKVLKRLQETLMDEIRKQRKVQEVCERLEIEVEGRTIYEHWLVTPFLAKQLEEKGELVQDVLGLQVWGRTCTGQAIYLDGVINNLAKELP
jgi:hypothetical protein